MMLGVVEHINDGAPNLARRLEHMIVVAVREHLASASKLTVDGPCDPDEQSLQPTRQRDTIFASQMRCM